MKYMKCDRDQRSNHSQRHTVRLHRGNYLAPWMTCRFSHRGDGKIMGSGLRLQSKESKRHCAWLHQGDSTAGAGFSFLFLKKINPRLWTYISFAVVDWCIEMYTCNMCVHVYYRERVGQARSSTSAQRAPSQRLPWVSTSKCSGNGAAARGGTLRRSSRSSGGR